MSTKNNLKRAWNNLGENRRRNVVEGKLANMLPSLFKHRVLKHSTHHNNARIQNFLRFVQSQTIRKNKQRGNSFGNNNFIPNIRNKNRYPNQNVYAVFYHGPGASKNAKNYVLMNSMFNKFHGKLG